MSDIVRREIKCNFPNLILKILIFLHSQGKLIVYKLVYNNSI